jgi:hypothetical protein
VKSAHVELLYAVVIVLVLLGMAAYFAWKQWQTLRRLPGQTELGTDERRYQYAQAWRRLISSGLMVVLAGLLVGSYWLGQERRAVELGQPEQVADEGGERRLPSIEDQRFLTQYSTFWIVFGMVLLGLVFLAFLDMFAIRRFARKHLRQINADRRAMIEHQVAEYRRQRNGFS